MKLPAIILFFLGLSLNSVNGQYGRDFEKALDNNTVTLHTDSGHTLHFDIKAIKKKPDFDRNYRWYSAGRIHQSQGGYSGKVLHGSYREQYQNNNLATKGTFKNGLKDGRWSSWNLAGKLTKQSSWRKGQETGPYVLSDDDGYLLERGRLLDGKRDGEIFLYSTQDSTYKNHYFDQGIETTAEAYYAKQNIWKRSGNYFSRQWARLFGRKNEA